MTYLSAEAHVIGVPLGKFYRTKQGLLVQLLIVDAVRKPRHCNSLLYEQAEWTSCWSCNFSVYDESL